MLEETESMIKHYVNATKNNFIKVGKLLKQILQAQEYKELDFTSFENYADSERFYKMFQMHSGHAFSLIDVYEKFGNLNSNALELISLRQLIELAKVKDVEVRDELIKQAPFKNIEEVKSKTIERFSSNISEEVSKTDDKEDKCLRLAETILNQLKSCKQDYTNNIFNIKISYSKLVPIAFKYPNNERIQELKNQIDKELD